MRRQPKWNNFAFVTADLSEALTFACKELWLRKLWVCCDRTRNICASLWCNSRFLVLGGKCTGVSCLFNFFPSVRGGLGFLKKNETVFVKWNNVSENAGYSCFYHLLNILMLFRGELWLITHFLCLEIGKKLTSNQVELFCDILLRI